METDINEPKSRAFNLFLRLLQLGLSLAATVAVAELKCKHCIPMDAYRAVEVLSLLVLILGVVGVCVMRCSPAHPKVPFLVLLVITLVVLAGMLLTVLLNYAGATDCAYNEAFYRYYIAQIIQYAVVGAIVLLLPFYGSQRYTNSPGNLAFGLVFLSWIWKWEGAVSTLFWLLSCLILIVSATSLACNLFLFCNGVTTASRACTMTAWVVELVLLVVAEVVAALILLRYSNSQHFANYEGNVAIALLWSFLAVNLIDFIFWVVGLKTLNHEQGDKIRDELLQFGRNDEWEEQQEEYQSKTPDQRDINP